MHNINNCFRRCSWYVFFVCLVVVSVFILSSHTTFADTASTNSASITVSSACTFLAGGGTYSNTVIGGQIGAVTSDPITVACNDASGYAVYAVGYSDDTYDGSYHTDMISTLNNSYNIKTNGTSGASYWKMKLQDLSNATIANNYGDYQAIPSSLTKVVSYATNTQAASFTPVYQIYIGVNQPADTYTGKVKYTLVHPNTMVAGSYTLSFNANGGSGSMSNETGIYNFEEYTLPTGSFTAPSGYIFAGWCTTNTAGSYACDGTSYAAGTAVTNLVSAGGTVTLYAYYKEPPYMQDQTASTLAAMMPNVGDTTVMRDRRDSIDNANFYTIAKLKDGRYWMVTNLNLAGGTAITCDMSDCDDYNVPSSQGWQSGGRLPASSASSFSGDNNAAVYNSGNTTDCGASEQDTPCYSYYSWDAATIGSGRSTSTDNTDAPYSICPKGWKLPSTRTTGADDWKTESDFYVLAHQYGLDTSYSTSELDDGFYIQAGPGTKLDFLLAGRYYNGVFYDGGVSGCYWSATSRNGTSNARLLVFSTALVNTANDYARRNGLSVRCLFKGAD